MIVPWGRDINYFLLYLLELELVDLMLCDLWCGLLSGLLNGLCLVLGGGTGEFTPCARGNGNGVSREMKNLL